MTSTIRYKKCANDTIVELIPYGKNNEIRQVYDKNYAGYRCESAYIVRIYNMFTRQERSQTLSLNGTILYNVNSIVSADGFDDDLNKVYANGIHYFLSFMAACYYHLTSIEMRTGMGSEYIFHDDGQLSIKISSWI